MLVIKSILLMCLAKYGYSLQYPKTIQDLDVNVSRCTDKVAECYYVKKGDVFVCLKKENAPQDQW